MADGDYWRTSDNMRAEWEAWQAVNQEFKRLGMDINRSTFNRLIKSVCVWGEYLSILRQEQTEEQRRHALNSYLAQYGQAKSDSV